MKVIKKENVRVEIIPEPPNPFIEPTHEDLIEVCREIEKSIRRHVDKTQRVLVVWDRTERCSHCGCVWEEDKDGPVCCSAAQNEWDAEKAKKP